MIKVFKEKPGVISPEPTWVGFNNYYMFTHKRLLGLLWLMIREHNNERHLVG